MGILGQLKARSIDGTGGLITVVVQDRQGKDVLMVAYANEEALDKTLKTGLAHYYSTSRKKLWLKGEESGNTQRVHEVLVDCDGDAVLYVVDQKGGACHTGHRTCFFRRADGGKLTEFEDVVFDPGKAYVRK